MLLSTVAANSALLKHLQEAGLLTEVSSLLVRAKSRDEAQLKKMQQQAKGRSSNVIKGIRPGLKDARE